jgi:hypothetical protein
MTARETKVDKALGLLRKPNAMLVQLHTNRGTGFYIFPNGGPVSDEVARALLEHADLQPHDSGLFPGHPQSWRLGNWRSAS